MGTPYKNAISLLKEYHDRMKKKSPAVDPAYSISPVEGKLFSCTCTYKGLTTESTRTSKNGARTSAAELMLEKLNVAVPVIRPAVPVIDSSVTTASQSIVPMDISPSNSYSTSSLPLSSSSSSSSSDMLKLALDFFEKYSISTGRFIRYPPSPEDLETCFCDINFGLKSPTAPKSKTLYERLDAKMHAIPCFEQVMNELNFKFCVDQIEVDPDLKGKAFVVLLRIDFCCMVVGGLGTSLSEAIEKACRNGLDALRLYMN